MGENFGILPHTVHECPYCQHDSGKCDGHDGVEYR